MNTDPSPADFPTVLADGPRLYLRPIRLDDVTDDYHRWMNDPEVVRYLESRFTRHSHDDLRRYVAGRLADPDNAFLAIVLKDGHRHVGNLKLGPIDRRHWRAEIGILIGEKDLWGRGYATEALRAVQEFAFGRLGLHKLTAGCYACNPGSAAAFEKAGFWREGVRKEHCLVDGTFVDVILLGRVRP